MALTEYYKSLVGTAVKTNSLQNYYNTLAERGKQKLYQAEVKDTGMDSALYTQLRERGVTAKEIKQIQPEKINYFKELEKTALGTVTGLLNQGIKPIRGTSQLAATP